MSAPLVIRRAQGAPRDTERVAAALRTHAQPVGAALGAALRDDRWGVVLLAERRGAVEGVLVLRFVYAVGATAAEGPVRAELDGVFGADAETREALIAAAQAEAEARELPLRAGAGPSPCADAPGAQPSLPMESLFVGGADALRFTAGSAAPAMATRWSGALAFRARWSADLTHPTWSVEGCLGADDDGDALRFDATTRALREVYLARPSRTAADVALLARVRSVAPRRGQLALAAEVSSVSLPPMEFALFDVSLDVLAAVPAALPEGELTAVAVTDALALLFVDGVYVGWRVTDPVAYARPMGWPDAERGGPPSRREALTALLHDWMVIDATDRPRPDEVEDPEDIAHMTALRARARALAVPGEPGDPTPGVAKDIGAHVHWGWGFFRVPDRE